MLLILQFGVKFMTRLSQGLGNGCTGISILIIDMDGADADIWGLDDLTIY
jgi:hypothetical protein